MKYTIEEYENMIKSPYPCFFICNECMGMPLIERVDCAPKICGTCEGSRIKIIPDNTTNNPFVLKDVIACVVKSDRDKLI